jgi:hypothetical protein
MKSAAITAHLSDYIMQESFNSKIALLVIAQTTTALPEF